MFLRCFHDAAMEQLRFNFVISSLHGRSGTNEKQRIKDNNTVMFPKPMGLAPSQTSTVHFPAYSGSRDH